MNDAKKIKKENFINNKIINFISFTILFIITILFAILKYSNLTVIFGILASILLLYNIKQIVGNYISIAFIFSAFHVIYGLSGPISVVWFNGLTSTYGTEYNIFPYMIAYSLVSIFYYIGFYICHIFYVKKGKKNIEYEDIKTDNISTIDKYRKYFLFAAECGLAITLLFELINFVRVGGFPTVLRGKAIYQAAVDELKYTLPSSEIFQVSISSLCVYLFISLKKRIKISKKTLVFLFIIMIPYFVLLLFLGKRGNILTFIMMIVLVFFQYKPMNRISKKFILWIILLYFVLGSMFAVRNYTSLIFKDFGEFTTKVFDKNNLISAFNPGQNEFGCTFGNFNKLYLADDYEFLYGSSYIKGITHFIPSYFYPGEKPQLLMYQFRDKYFPFKAQISSIAGTAFSSILETYWNFGYFGSLIYCIYGFIIGYLEFFMKKKSMFKFMYYISFIPYIYEFHRSDFGHISFGIILMSAMICFIYLFYKFIYKKSKAIRKVCDTVTNPKIIIIKLMNIGFFNWMSDEKYLKLRYRLFLNKKLNLENPKTFNEKLQWLKIHDRKDIYTTMVDKVDVKEYITKLIGKEYIIPTIGVYDSFDDINFNELPSQFVIKCSHDSGGLFICRDKSKFNKDIARKKINSRMSKNYYYIGREWQYKNVKPRIIVEKFMEVKRIDRTNNQSKKNVSAELLQQENGLLDYKFMCFNGEVKFLFLDIGVIGKGTSHAEKYYRNIYNRNFELQPFLETRENYPISIKKPKNFDKMIEIAEKISKNLLHARIDLYNIDGKIYFGEITFYHGSGLYNFFIPEKYDDILGSYINIKNTDK